MQLVSEQTWDEVDVMRLLEPLTTDVIVRLGGSEHTGSIRVEWIIAGCWKSRHDTIIEHDDSRRTDMLQAYVVLLLRGTTDCGQNERNHRKWWSVWVEPQVDSGSHTASGDPGV